MEEEKLLKKQPKKGRNKYCTNACYCGRYVQPRNVAMLSIKGKDDDEYEYRASGKKQWRVYMHDRNGKYRVALRKYSERKMVKFMYY